MTDTPTEGGGEGTWAKLRRRKVVQWGIAYAAGAWGLLQGVAYVTDTFHWPDQIQQLATIALLIGLPIALVIAWYHGDRGQQRLSAPELTILTLLFVVGGASQTRRLERPTVQSSSLRRYAEIRRASRAPHLCLRWIGADLAPSTT